MRPSTSVTARVESAGRVKVQAQTVSYKSSEVARIAQQTEALDRAFADVSARLAVRGFALAIVDDGGAASYCITRWNLHRYLATLGDVESFADSVGAAP